MDDKEIVGLLKQSPSEGLYEVIKKYRGLVQSICVRILPNNDEDVEECIADTFVSIWKNCNSIDESRGSFKGYIASTARNTAINRYRSLIRNNCTTIEDMEIVSDDVVIKELENQFDMDTLQVLIAEMKEPDREIFLRKYYFLEKIKDIANRFKVDETYVKNRLYRSRLKLKKELEDRGVVV